MLLATTLAVCACALVFWGSAKTAQAAPATSYTITVESVDDKGDLVTGYYYELRDAQNNVIKTFDFLTGDAPKSQSLRVAAGTYKLFEIIHPDRFLPSDGPVTITFPYRDPEGKMVNRVTVTPKHQEKTPVEKPDKPRKPHKPTRYLPKTADDARIAVISGLIGIVGASLVTGAARRLCQKGGAL